MRILIVMGGFFPGKKYGGPPVSVDNFCTLMDMHECFIVTQNHDMGESAVYQNVKAGWNDRGNCKVLYLTNAEYGSKKFEDVIREINPNIIYLQGLFQNCIIPCLTLAKKYHIPVMLAPRGELCAGAFKKKYKKIPYILFLKAFGLISNTYFQSTSEEESNAIIRILGVSKDRVFYLTNIPSIPSIRIFRMPKKEGSAKFVFLSRIHPKKNLIGAIHFFTAVKGKAVLDIYGPIEDTEYWNQCREEIKKMPTNVQINYCGLVAHDEVFRTFSQYDAFIFPTFSENYGHVIAESLVVGTPVLLGRGSTPWDDIDGVAGFVGQLSDNEAFSGYIDNIISMNQEAYGQLSKSIEQYIKKKLNIKELRDCYSSALEIICQKGGE